MGEIPTAEELAQTMRDASGGQPLSIEQLAEVAHAEVIRRMRAASAARMRKSRATRAERLRNLAHAS